MMKGGADSPRPRLLRGSVNLTVLYPVDFGALMGMTAMLVENCPAAKVIEVGMLA